jgi:hypothetical protein
MALAVSPALLTYSYTTIKQRLSPKCYVPVDSCRLVCSLQLLLATAALRNSVRLQNRVTPWHSLLTLTKGEHDFTTNLFSTQVSVIREWNGNWQRKRGFLRVLGALSRNTSGGDLRGDRSVTMSSEKEAALAAVPNDSPTMWAPAPCPLLSREYTKRTALLFVLRRGNFGLNASYSTAPVVLESPILPPRFCSKNSTGF